MTDGTKPSGLSVWESDLFRHLTLHTEHEGVLLGAYKTLSEQAEAEYVTYLVGLILDDEIRHHRLLTELLNALRGRVERTDGASVPVVSDAENPVKLLVATEKLLEREEDDARELKRFNRQLRDLRGASVWPVLIDMMKDDTEKHQGILRFVKQQLDEQLTRARTSWVETP